MERESERPGWLWLNIRSAEGRRHPDNVRITADEYEASRAEALRLLAPRLDEMRATLSNRREAERG